MTRSSFLASRLTRHCRHVTEVVRSCSYHTRALRHIRPLLTLDVANSVGHSIVASRLDYANALLHGIDQQPPQAAGCLELFGQSGLSGPALCQCHRVTSTAPLASSPAKNQLQACRHHRLNGSSSPVLTATCLSYGSPCDFIFFPQRTWRSHPWTDFDAKWLKRRGFTHGLSYHKYADDTQL